MNSIQVLALQEFRRFVNLHIYPELAPTFIVPVINNNFNVEHMNYESQPQAMIKFDYCLSDKDQMTSSGILAKSHDILKLIFVDFFNNPEVKKIIRNKIYMNIVNEETKQYLNMALSEIQSGNQQYLSLLFNITSLNCNIIYLYL